MQDISLLIHVFLCDASVRTFLEISVRPNCIVSCLGKCGKHLGLNKKVKFKQNSPISPWSPTLKNKTYILVFKRRVQATLALQTTKF